jgi:fumarate hydratase class II
MTPTTRTEHDSLGDVQVPADALWGAQTERARHNFPISGQTLPQPFIDGLLHIKAAAAEANQTLGVVSEAMGDAIEAACVELLAMPDRLRHFPLDVYQTGSGTSTNMNANEVVATLAARRLGAPVSANDHVNAGQSSNDAIPSAIHVAAALLLAQALLPALQRCREVVLKKGASLSHVVKTGRTHLMDAMPVRFDQVLGGWAEQLQGNVQRLQSLQAQLQALAQGGTAVGTGVNAHPDFAALFHTALSERTGLVFAPAAHYFAAMGSQDVAAALSGQLKTLAVTLMKIANDLRWMNSGPLAGLGEIELEALQPGSSIMPGKVNPVIPEAAAMVAAQVIGNDAAITIAGQSGNFELNVMLPLVAHRLVESLQLLSHVLPLLSRSIETFKVREEQLQQALSRNPILATALNPVIGYAKAAEIAKQAYAEGRPVLDVAVERTGLPREQLAEWLDPARLTHGGLQH